MPASPLILPYPIMNGSVTRGATSSSAIPNIASPTPNPLNPTGLASPSVSKNFDTLGNRTDEAEDEEDEKPYFNPHPNVLDLPHAFYVDQAIMTEEDRLVVIRFGDHRHPDCQRQDEVLEKCAKVTRDWCVFYKCDNRHGKVPDFNSM